MKKSAAEKNRCAASRLKYMMQVKNKRDVDLINYVLDNTDLYVSAPMMSQYLNGTKHIPQNIAMAFSTYLGIDAGYIIGLDGYLSQNNDYYVYCSVMRLKGEIKNMESQADLYNKYLSHEGYLVKSISRNKGKISTITISDQDKKEYLLTPKELNSYIKDISKYYKTRTKQLINTALKEGDALD